MIEYMIFLLSFVGLWITLIWINEEFEQVFKKMSLSFSNNPPKLNPKM